MKLESLCSIHCHRHLRAGPPPQPLSALPSSPSCWFIMAGPLSSAWRLLLINSLHFSQSSGSSSHLMILIFYLDLYPPYLLLFDLCICAPRVVLRWACLSAPDLLPPRPFPKKGGCIPEKVCFHGGSCDGLDHRLCLRKLRFHLSLRWQSLCVKKRKKAKKREGNSELWKARSFGL